MSSLACEIWFPNPITGEQVQKINALIHRIGVNISPSEQRWKELPGSAQARGETELPIDKFIERASSGDLKQHLLARRDYLIERPELQINRQWSFQFANSTPFIGAPSADKYAREGIFPTFAIILTHDLWRLMTGWGTSEFSSERGIRDTYSKLEHVYAALGTLPFASLFMMSPFPYDGLLMGYLALWVMDYLAGFLEVQSRTIDIPENLDRLVDQNQRGEFPGKIYRFVNTYDTPQGARTHIWHVVDADFLREWITRSEFGLF
jgi:hypothetical protein